MVADERVDWELLVMPHRQGRDEIIQLACTPAVDVCGANGLARAGVFGHVFHPKPFAEKFLAAVLTSISRWR